MSNTLLRILLIPSLCLSLVVVSSAAQPPSLRERARRENVTIVSLPAYPTATLEDLVTMSDTIVVGQVQGNRSVLSDDETNLSTDYTVIVERVIMSSATGSKGVGPTIVVRRPGGVLTVPEGFSIVSEESGFTPFNDGDRLLWFLGSDPKANVYQIAYGPQGVFKITGNTASQVSGTFEGSIIPRGPLSVEQLLNELTRVLTTSAR
jgi:hypothetical protein